VHNLSELSVKARSTPLTPQGLLDGVVRLAYEVGESKVDGGESRVSGTSLDDMRNNVDGIELAWCTIFSPATASSTWDSSAWTVSSQCRGLHVGIRRNCERGLASKPIYY
jgi:hypothetical protein